MRFSEFCKHKEQIILHIISSLKIVKLSDQLDCEQRNMTILTVDRLKTLINEALRSIEKAIRNEFYIIEPLFVI